MNTETLERTNEKTAEPVRAWRCRFKFTFDGVPYMIDTEKGRIPIVSGYEKLYGPEFPSEAQADRYAKHMIELAAFAEEHHPIGLRSEYVGAERQP